MSLTNYGFEAFAVLTISFLGLGFVTEITKAVIASISGAAQRKRLKQKRELLKQEVDTRLVLYWREVAYDTRRIAIEHGVPRDQLPELNPPSVPDDWGE